MKLAPDVKIYAGLGVGLLALLWWATRPGNAANVGSAAVQAVGNLATGAVQGAGQIVGIPATSASKCKSDLAAGNYWDASFSCPAGTYLGGLYDAATRATTPTYGSKYISDAAANDARRVFAQNDPRRLDLYDDDYDYEPVTATPWL